MPAEGKKSKSIVSDLDRKRIDKKPTRSKFLLEHGKNQNQGFIIKTIELRQYIEKHDSKLGDYSLLTAVVETDKGSVEMKYDEGFRGDDAFDSAVTMLMQYVGLASLINRALIDLQRAGQKSS